ncbi:hypothetical protein CGRA01v4_10753 [Colletotrichum graminicola]|nr:hypothetical protein CGRA01v4_10753 [Colletotrichum graminicola]
MSRITKLTEVLLVRDYVYLQLVGASVCHVATEPLALITSLLICDLSKDLSPNIPSTFWLLSFRAFLWRTIMTFWPMNEGIVVLRQTRIYSTAFQSVDGWTLRWSIRQGSGSNTKSEPSAYVTRCEASRPLAMLIHCVNEHVNRHRALPRAELYKVVVICVADAVRLKVPTSVKAS